MNGMNVIESASTPKVHEMVRRFVDLLWFKRKNTLNRLGFSVLLV
jgi:hypothetical protein